MLSSTQPVLTWYDDDTVHVPKTHYLIVVEDSRPLCILGGHQICKLSFEATCMDGADIICLIATTGTCEIVCP